MRCIRLFSGLVCAIVSFAATPDPGATFVRASSRPVGVPACIYILPDLQNYVKTLTTGCNVTNWGTLTDPNDDGTGCEQRQQFNAIWKHIKDETCSAKLVMSVGDLVQDSGLDHDEDPNQDIVEFDRVNAMIYDLVENHDIPVVLARGDHDSFRKFWQFFGPTPDVDKPSSGTSAITWADEPWYVGHNDLGCNGSDPHLDPNDPSLPDTCTDTMCVYPDMGGWNLLACGISCSPNPNEIEWVRDQIDYYAGDPNDPDDILRSPVAFTVHFGLNPAKGAGNGGTHQVWGSGTSSCVADTSFSATNTVFDDLVGYNEGAALLSVSGHNAGVWTEFTDPNDASETSDMSRGLLDMVCNFQSGIRSDGGRGYICEIYIDPQDGTFTLETHSPYENRQITEDECFDEDEAGDPTDRRCVIQPRLEIGGANQLHERYSLVRTGDATIAHAWSIRGPRTDLGVTDNTFLTVDGDDAFISDDTIFDRVPTGPLDANRIMTMNIWFRCISSGSKMCIAGDLEGDGGNERYGVMLDPNGMVQFHWGDQTVQGTTDLCDNSWHQAWFGYNPTHARDVRAFIDFSELTVSNLSAAAEKSDDAFVVGACNDGAGGYQHHFVGDIDGIWFESGNQQFRYYEVQGGMAAPLDPTTHGSTKRDQDIRDHPNAHEIEAWWPIGSDEDTINLISDEQGNRDLIRDAP